MLQVTRPADSSLALLNRYLMDRYNAGAATPQPSNSFMTTVQPKSAALRDPLTDLGLLMFSWPQPGEPQIPLVPTVSTLEGFPSRSHLLSRYAERTGRDVSAVPFYEAFARFKFAVIIQGVAARSAAGMMAGQDFGDVESDVVQLAEAGLDALGAV